MIARPRPKGGRSIRQDGYALRLAHGHPRADGGGYVLEHILIAEEALGKQLPAGAVIHHTDEKQGQITPRGLVICPDKAYHALIHQRLRALAASGHADWRKCQFCQRYDEPKNLSLTTSHSMHRECSTNARAVLDGKKMLRNIQSRFGHRVEFASVVKAIEAYLSAKGAA